LESLAPAKLLQKANQTNIPRVNQNITRTEPETAAVLCERSAHFAAVATGAFATTASANLAGDHRVKWLSAAASKGFDAWFSDFEVRIISISFSLRGCRKCRQ
jgi:hypothetical protein